MNLVQIQSQGEGQYALSGQLSFATTPELLRRSHKEFVGNSVLVIDLKGISASDSSGLALLIEWMRWAKKNQLNISFRNIPEQIQAIAEACDVDKILPV